MTSGYDEVLMDHIRHARNYRAMTDASVRLTADNPLCGDHVEIFLRWEGEVLADASFQCECCGISMASTSVMTHYLIGRSRGDVVRAASGFLARVEECCREGASAQRAGAAGAQDPSPDLRAVLAAVRTYPTRAGCASIAWKSVLDALS